MVISLLWAVDSPLAQSNILDVLYPEDSAASNDRSTAGKYVRDLLKLALEYSGTPYQLRPVTVGTISESRSELYLKSGRYNLHWLMTTKNYEGSLIPIRIPIYKGLIGWRLFFINRSNEQRFNRHTSAEDIKQLRACLGHDWPDVKIMQRAGYRVATPINNVEIFDVLLQGRCDYFPRSILEIWNEYGSARKRGLTVAPGVALHYPAAYYFFVSPSYPVLAEALQKGLLIAIDNGSFDSLFNKYFYIDILNANLEKRNIIPIENPLFSQESLVEHNKLWFNIDD